MPIQNINVLFSINWIRLNGIYQTYRFGDPKDARINRNWEKKNVIYRWVNASTGQVATLGETDRQMNSRANNYCSAKPGYDVNSAQAISVIADSAAPVDRLIAASVWFGDHYSEVVIASGAKFWRDKRPCRSLPCRAFACMRHSHNFFDKMKLFIHWMLSLRFALREMLLISPTKHRPRINPVSNMRTRQC